MIVIEPYKKKRAISILKLLVWIKFEEMISSYNVD